MSYYQGDYYQGDYYQGDFWGKLGGFFKSGLKTAAVVGAGLIPGVGGYVAGGVRALASRGVGRKMLAAGATGAALSPTVAGRFQIPLPGPNVMRPLAALPGGIPFIGPPDLRQLTNGNGCPVACPSGFHPNKSASTARETFGAPPGSICVKNRSMNVANPRALRRGLRRVSGFSKLAARSRKDIKRAAKIV